MALKASVKITKAPDATATLDGEIRATVNANARISSGVYSWNGMTGYVTYDGVTSVNGESGDVTVAVPTKTSELTNDSGFITAESDPVFTASPAHSITTADISAWNAKQNALNFDSTPTENSTNPVTSGGVYSGLQTVAGTVNGKVDLFSIAATQVGTSEEYTLDKTVAEINAAIASGKFVVARIGTEAIPYATTVTYFGASVLVFGSCIAIDGALLIRGLAVLPDGTAAMVDTLLEFVTSVNGKGGAVILDAADVGALPDTTVIPTKTSDLTNDNGFITGINSTDVTAALGYTPYNATNPNGYVNSSQAAAAAPVKSVNGQTGAVTISVPTVPTNVSDFTNDAGYVTASTAPVRSVNGQTGAVSLTIPTVPSNVSAFTNDAGYLTLSTLPIYDGSVS